MGNKTGGTAEAVRRIAEPVAEELGLILWDVLFQKEGPSMVLRLIIDKPGGVFIDDCETLSRTVDPLIDEANIIENEYCFEVSSPGLMRELRTDAHLAAYTGKKIVIKLYKPDESGKKELFGSLLSFDGEKLTIEAEDGNKEIMRNDAASVKADDDIQIGGIKK
ncbi:MAG: ribosome maturation factor RimP [Ruminococcaceae bacterium]|jgi:ribosome maturation factor RimP|nr:ribosome maturation factor RimP [Oscillospiraceae bacterium]